jgi:hypothetical protein
MKNRTEITKGLCKLLRLGLSRAAACDCVEIDRRTFYRWLADNAHFATAIKKASAQFVEDAVARINCAAADPKNWTAAAWLLERRCPEDYGRDRTMTREQLVTLGLETLGESIRDYPAAMEAFLAMQAAVQAPSKTTAPGEKMLTPSAQAGA